MFAKVKQILTAFSSLSRENKVKTLLCPASNIASKLSNKFIAFMFKIEEGLHTSILTFPPQVSNYQPPDLDLSNLSDVSEGDMVGYISDSENETDHKDCQLILIYHLKQKINVI